METTNNAVAKESINIYAVSIRRGVPTRSVVHWLELTSFKSDPTELIAFVFRTNFDECGSTVSVLVNKGHLDEALNKLVNNENTKVGQHIPVMELHEGMIYLSEKDTMMVSKLQSHPYMMQVSVVLSGALLTSSNIVIVEEALYEGLRQIGLPVNWESN